MADAEVADTILGCSLSVLKAQHEYYSVVGEQCLPADNVTTKML